MSTPLEKELTAAGEAGGETPRPRPKPHKHRGHGGAWKVAYADFVTALLALFIVLWVLGQDQTIKEAVQSYFRDPVGINKSGGNPVSIGKGPPPSPIDTDIGEELKKKLETEIDRMQGLLQSSEMLKQIADQIVFEVTNEGIRIEFRDAPKFSFYDIGSAQVTTQLREIFKLLTPEIIQIGYQVVIEGHSDKRQYGTQNYTNWELSADRANSIRRVMLDYGLPLEKISEVRAYADTKLLNPADPYALENRRVSILLKNPLVVIDTKIKTPSSIPVSTQNPG